MRLNTKALSGGGHSLSMALLALYLLNGEIMTGSDRFEHQDHQSDLTETMLQLICNRSLGSFSPPVAQKLTFAKNCRFGDVKLTDLGVQTKGHIWKLGKPVVVSPYLQPIREHGPRYGLTHLERQCLHSLADQLKYRRLGSRYNHLAAKLRGYLAEDAAAKIPSAAKDFKDCMAREVIEAMQSRKPITMALVMDLQQPKRHSPYSGLVIGDDWGPREYIFTSWGRAGTFSNIGRHVCLGVNMHGCTEDGLAKVTTNKWVNGLFFFDNVESQPVVFPWPTSFVR